MEKAGAVAQRLRAPALLEDQGFYSQLRRDSLAPSATLVPGNLMPSSKPRWAPGTKKIHRFGFRHNICVKCNNDKIAEESTESQLLVSIYVQTSKCLHEHR